LRAFSPSGMAGARGARRRGREKGEETKGERLLTSSPAISRAVAGVVWRVESGIRRRQGYGGTGRAAAVQDAGARFYGGRPKHAIGGVGASSSRRAGLPQAAGKAEKGLAISSLVYILGVLGRLGRRPDGGAGGSLTYWGRGRSRNPEFRRVWRVRVRRLAASGPCRATRPTFPSGSRSQPGSR